MSVGPGSDEGRNIQYAQILSVNAQYPYGDRPRADTRREEDARERWIRESLLVRECVEPVGQEHSGADFSLCSSLSLSDYGCRP